MSRRVYLDWNASAPLRPEARAAMLAAMDAVANPSSVHAEGRAARAVVERARAQVAGLAGTDPQSVVFTGSASEAVATVLASHGGAVHVSPVAHDCLTVHVDGARASTLPLDDHGRVAVHKLDAGPGDLVCVSSASGETGILENADLPAAVAARGALLLSDMVQTAGRVARSGADFAVLSSAKLGGPPGVGALVVREGLEVDPLIPGGGQEGRRRAGTENVVGIAGFGAAAEAAAREFDSGVWAHVEKLRNILEARLEAVAPDTIFVGRDASRLPNTSCFVSPGWKSETQVMQMDLAGFAVSAGSACSSGKVGPSRALKAMGFSDEEAASALRVSLGPATTEAEVMAFADAWDALYRRRRKAA